MKNKYINYVIKDKYIKITYNNLYHNSKTYLIFSQNFNS